MKSPVKVEVYIGAKVKVKVKKHIEYTIRIFKVLSFQLFRREIFMHVNIRFIYWDYLSS